MLKKAIAPNGGVDGSYIIPQVEIGEVLVQASVLLVNDLVTMQQACC